MDEGLKEKRVGPTGLPRSAEGQAASLHVVVLIVDGVGLVDDGDGAVGFLLDGSLLEQLRQDCCGLLVVVGRRLGLCQAFFELGDLLFAFFGHRSLQVVDAELVLHLGLSSSAFRPGFHEVSRVAVRSYVGDSEVSGEDKVRRKM